MAGKTLSDYTKLRKTVMRYIERAYNQGIDVKDFGLDISEFKTAKQLLKAATNPKTAWREVQRAEKELEAQYRETQKEIRKMKRNTKGKYTEYYDEFNSLTELLSWEITNQGRVILTDEITEARHEVVEYANQCRHSINTLLKEITQKIAQNYDKIGKYSKTDSAKIRIGYYICAVYQNNIPDDPYDLGYNGGPLRQALASLYWGYNEQQLGTISQAYKEITNLLNQISTNAGLLDEDESEGIFGQMKIDNRYEEDFFYGLDGDVEDMF